MKAKDKKKLEVVKSIVLGNDSVSFRDKGVFSMIIELKKVDYEDWSIKRLAEMSHDGPDGTRTSIKNLESFGYMSRGQKRGNENHGGQFGKADWLVHYTVDGHVEVI